jgi:hypothetical protein
MTSATTSSASIYPSLRTLQAPSATALKWAAGFWFAVTAAGQLFFVAYLAMFYGGAVMRGNLAGWNKVVAHAYVPGSAVGNTVFGTHILMAAIIMLGGLLQLVPQVRARWPVFHRWNGRVYVVSAVAASLAGLWMVWFRANSGDLVQHLGITLNATVVMLCAFMAVRHAMARRLVVHRRWALRLFLAVSGVWFFRVGLMFWIAINKGPAGFDPATFTGPALNVLSFGQTLLPLAVLELYLGAQAGGGAVGRIAMAAGLVLLTLAMCLGIGVAAMAMWLPHM